VIASGEKDVREGTGIKKNGGKPKINSKKSLMYNAGRGHSRCADLIRSAEKKRLGIK